MDRKQEKDVIRVLCQAGKESLAKAFAQSRGYRVKGIEVNALFEQTRKMRAAEKAIIDASGILTEAVMQLEDEAMKKKLMKSLQDLAKVKWDVLKSASALQRAKL